MFKNTSGNVTPRKLPSTDEDNQLYQEPEPSIPPPPPPSPQQQQQDDQSQDENEKKRINGYLKEKSIVFIIKKIAKILRKKRRLSYQTSK
jgi:pyruvate/2-oxoacid:ferredoxin oxidoreductase alpha subunit